MWRAMLVSSFLLSAVVPVGAMALASGVITPIGPFCPFRSAVCSDGGPLGSAIGELAQTKMPKFATEMARIQIEMQSGSMPDGSRMRAMADDLTDAESEWRSSAPVSVPSIVRQQPHLHPHHLAALLRPARSLV
jgi:hypothetical protein